MKYLGLIVIFFISLVMGTPLENVRNQFPTINSLEQTEKYLDELENEEDETLQGYFAAMYFMKSKYVKFPLTKLKYFKKGKLLLDELISNNQNNIEIRYIRYLLQSEIPDFLGYNNYLEEDFFHIIENVEASNLNRNFKLKMLQNILISKRITDQKEQKIKQLLKVL